MRARRSQRLKVVLTREEVARLLDVVDRLPTDEPYGLMARLMYGAGLRLMECCRLRLKDVDFLRLQITVREGKGDKDRVVMLPRCVPAATPCGTASPRTCWRWATTSAPFRTCSAMPTSARR